MSTEKSVLVGHLPVDEQMRLCKTCMWVDQLATEDPCSSCRATLVEDNSYIATHYKPDPLNKEPCDQCNTGCGSFKTCNDPVAQKLRETLGQPDKRQTVKAEEVEQHLSDELWSMVKKLAKRQAEMEDVLKSFDNQLHELNDRDCEVKCTGKDTAHIGPFTTVRACLDCGVLVTGGPTRCVACVKQEELRSRLANVEVDVDGMRAEVTILNERSVDTADMGKLQQEVLKLKQLHDYHDREFDSTLEQLQFVKERILKLEDVAKQMRAEINVLNDKSVDTDKRLYDHAAAHNSQKHWVEEEIKRLDTLDQRKDFAKLQSDFLRSEQLLKEEIKRIDSHLQIDPGGSDRLDEFEDSLKYAREDIAGNGMKLCEIDNRLSKEFQDIWYKLNRLSEQSNFRTEVSMTEDGKHSGEIGVLKEKVNTWVDRAKVVEQRLAETQERLLVVTLEQKRIDDSIAEWSKAASERMDGFDEDIASFLNEHVGARTAALERTSVHVDCTDALQRQIEHLTIQVTALAEEKTKWLDAKPLRDLQEKVAELEEKLEALQGPESTHRRLQALEGFAHKGKDKLEDTARLRTELESINHKIGDALSLSRRVHQLEKGGLNFDQFNERMKKLETEEKVTEGLYGAMLRTLKDKLAELESWRMKSNNRLKATEYAVDKLERDHTGRMDAMVVNIRALQGEKAAKEELAREKGSPCRLCGEVGHGGRYDGDNGTRCCHKCLTDTKATCSVCGKGDLGSWMGLGLGKGVICLDCVEKSKQEELKNEELEAQRRGFVAGNVGLSNPNVTREVVDKVADDLAELDSSRPVVRQYVTVATVMSVDNGVPRIVAQRTFQKQEDAEAWLTSDKPRTSTSYTSDWRKQAVR